MDSWNEIARIAPTSGSTSRPSISSLLFDTTQNLLWCGDSDGYTRSVTSDLLPYTRFKTANSNEPVVQYLNHKEGILSLLNSNINFNNRRGLNKLNVTENGLNCMTTGNISSDILVGTKEGLLKFDISKSGQVTLFDHVGGVSLVKSTNKVVVLGKDDGGVEMFDTVGNRSIKNFVGHNGVLSDMDIQGSYVATCGYSLRRRRTNVRYLAANPTALNLPFGSNALLGAAVNAANAASQPLHDLVVDPLINIYDVRMMKPISPYPFPSGASSVRFHPKLPNIIIVLSSTGQIQFVDIYDQTNVYFYQADVEELSNLEVSENGDFLCFSDNTNMHLWSMGNTLSNFVSFPALIEQQDITQPEPFIPVEDSNIPLNAVGMPYYKDLLLSNWPSDLHFIKPLTMAAQKLSTSATPGFIPYDEKYGPTTPQKYVSLKENRTSHFPKFLSEKKTLEGSMTYIPGDVTCYKKLRIQYSKFGVKDFDFGYYNKTNYCGLENHTDNSYVNSIIQLYRFQPQFYNIITGALTKEWLPLDTPHGSSLLNELGYLFDMMHKAREKNVTIANFSQVLSSIPQAAGLVNRNECSGLSSREVTTLGINFNKFFISQLHTDLLGQFQNNALEDLMKIDHILEVKSLMPSCPVHSKQSGALFSLDLVTPPSHVLNKMSILLNNKPQLATPSTTRKSHNLITYLDYLINQSHVVPCMNPHMLGHNLQVNTSVVKLPPLLTLNLNLSPEEFGLINSFRKWLVPEFYAIQGERLSIKSHFAAASGVTRYDLLGYVCEVTTDTSHLVTFVQVGGAWYLFNDFLVMQIPEEEVFTLYPWKRPITLLYGVVSEKQFDYTFNDVDDGILYKDHFASVPLDHFAGTIRESHKQAYVLLTREEPPSFGSLVAIDAEFVTLKPEELEVHFDGTRKLIKPKQLSLARLSVIRGQFDSPGFGVAFIDDFILHTAHIHDYTTNFSGIEPGDLDVERSNKNLVTLQTTYRKLWLLLNMGVVFIGHGLFNDFRCINLQVPREQIRDTAEFYYKSDFKRQLSLKFLTYSVLRTNVQVGNHDSIEDAHSALMLYKKYLDLKQSGEFEGVLDGVYLEGQLLRFRVP